MLRELLPVEAPRISAVFMQYQGHAYLYGGALALTVLGHGIAHLP